jgi:hypothetical protein
MLRDVTLGAACLAGACVAAAAQGPGSQGALDGIRHRVLVAFDSIIHSRG